MDSILETLQSQLGADVMKQIGAQIGADPQATQQAVSAALPMLLGAIGRNAAEPEGAQALASALRRDHDGGLLEDLAGFFGQGGNTQDGTGILGHVFGNRRGNVETGLSKATGLDAGSIAKLLALLAPVVMGSLGRTQRENNLDPSDLSDVLGRERKQAESSLGGLMGMLDRDGDGSVADDLLGIGTQLLGGFLRKS